MITTSGVQENKRCPYCGDLIEGANIGNRRFCDKNCRKRARIVAAALSPNRGLCTGTVGAISEIIVAVHLLRLGYDVFRAVSPSCSCDLIAIKDGRSFRVEVRTGTRRKDGTFGYSHPAKDKGRQDTYAVVVGNDIVFFPPFESIV